MGYTVTKSSEKGLLVPDFANLVAHNILHTENVEDFYDVEQVAITRGKFASVKLAREKDSGVEYILKYIRKRRRSTPLELEAKHEIAVLYLGRSNPHIIHLHKLHQTKHEYIAVLEYGRGGDLQQLLDEQEKFTESVTKKVLRQVMSGLQFLHDISIAHLDIKPQNIVMMGPLPEDGIKLVDFGLSRVIEKGVDIAQIMGTPDYVAPEVVNFEPVGLYTDMWAIGVLTYVFLSGHTPFGGDTDQETFVNITDGCFDYPETLFAENSHLAMDFISSLIVKVPSQRLTVQEAMDHQWMITNSCTTSINNNIPSYSHPIEEQPLDIMEKSTNQRCSLQPPLLIDNLANYHPVNSFNSLPRIKPSSSKLSRSYTTDLNLSNGLGGDLPTKSNRLCSTNNLHSNNYGSLKPIKHSKSKNTFPSSPALNGHNLFSEVKGSTCSRRHCATNNIRNEEIKVKRKTDKPKNNMAAYNGRAKLENNHHLSSSMYELPTIPNGHSKPSRSAKKDSAHLKSLLRQRMEDLKIPDVEDESAETDVQLSWPMANHNLTPIVPNGMGPCFGSTSSLNFDPNPVSSPKTRKKAPKKQSSKEVSPLLRQAINSFSMINLRNTNHFDDSRMPASPLRIEENPMDFMRGNTFHMSFRSLGKKSKKYKNDTKYI